MSTNQNGVSNSVNNPSLKNKYGMAKYIFFQWLVLMY